MEATAHAARVRLGALIPGRTERLKARMRRAVPSICVERARLVTESHRRTEGMPPVLRRAHALADTLVGMSVFIDDEELVVGNHGSTPRAALLFPEFGSFSEEELDMMPTRGVDTLQISEEHKRKLLEDIYPYWRGKSNEDLADRLFDAGTRRIMDSPSRSRQAPSTPTASGYARRG